MPGHKSRQRRIATVLGCLLQLTAALPSPDASAGGLTLPLRRREAAPFGVPAIHANTNATFLVEMTVGGQNVALQPRTGSRDVVLWDASAITASGGTPNAAARFYDPARSTRRAKAAPPYQDTSLFDTFAFVNVPGVTVPDFSFAFQSAATMFDPAVCSQVTTGGCLEGPPATPYNEMAGVLGLGIYSAQDAANLKTDNFPAQLFRSMDAAAAPGAPPTKRVLKINLPQSRPGDLTFGAYDESTECWAENASPEARTDRAMIETWAFELELETSHGKLIGTTQVPDVSVATIAIDSTTMYLDGALVDAYYDSWRDDATGWPRQIDNGSPKGGDRPYVYPCDMQDQSPEFWIRPKGLRNDACRILIKKGDMALHGNFVQTDFGKNMCMGRMQRAEQAGWVTLGSTVMASHEITLDYGMTGKPRVGIKQLPIEELGRRGP